MKHIISIIILFTVISTCHSQNKAIMDTDLEERNGLLYEKESKEPFTGISLIYDGERIEKEIEVKNGLANGFMRTFDRQGILREEISFVEGLANGECRVFFDDGSIMGKFTLTNGIMTDISIKFDESQTINTEMISKLDILKITPSSFDKLPLREGIANGITKIFYPNGNIKTEVYFKGGVARGEYRTFYENGSIHKNASFDDGILLFYQIYNEQEILIEEYYYNN